MRVSLRFLVAFAFLVGGIVFVTSKRTQANEIAAGETVAASRTLYRQHCAICHGNDGRSQTKRGRETEADDITSADVKGDSHERLVRLISNGKGEMPGFKKNLSPAKIASIAKYIKTL